MEEALKFMDDFKFAMLELIKKGNVKTSLIETPQGTFTRVSITINNVKHYADNIDAMIATIQLRNQI